MEKRERVDGGENSHDDYHNIWTKAYPSLAPHSLALPAHPMVAQALPPASQRGDNSDFGLAFRRGVFRFFARPLNFKVVPVRYFVRIWRPPGTGKGQGQLLSKAVHSLAFWNQQLKAVGGGPEHRTCSICLDEVCQLESLCIVACAPFFCIYPVPP